MTNKIRQQVILLVVAFVAVCLLFYNFLLAPLNLKTRDLQAKVNQQEAKLAQLKIRAQELPKLKAEMDLLKTEVAELEKLLPKDREMPALLRTITRKAQRYGLLINNFVAGKIEPKDNYSEMPFQVNLRGRYHPLARFLTDIGQENRLMSSRNLRLTYSPAANKADPTNIVVDFSLVAYMYKE